MEENEDWEPMDEEAPWVTMDQEEDLWSDTDLDEWLKSQND